VGDLTALEVVVTAPVVSFRNPLYAGVQVNLPCPPPATVAGMLAAATGGWGRVDPALRFAMAFRAGGTGVDLETYHPLDGAGRATEATPREREFLADVSLTVWLTSDLDSWQRRLRRPVWPLRLGRSQDLVAVRTRTVQLAERPGHQLDALLPGDASSVGTRLRLPTAVSVDRARTRWGDFRFDASGRSAEEIEESWSDPCGRAVILLPPSHPVHALN